jgi:hypothetical protein
MIPSLVILGLASANPEDPAAPVSMMGAATSSYAAGSSAFAEDVGREFDQ